MPANVAVMNAQQIESFVVVDTQVQRQSLELGGRGGFGGKQLHRNALLAGIFTDRLADSIAFATWLTVVLT